MYGQIQPGRRPPAAHRAEAMLPALFVRAARDGRLTTTPARATALLLATDVGVILSLVATPADARDLVVADDLCDAVLGALTTPLPAVRSDAAAGDVPESAARLREAVERGAGGFDVREGALLGWWLERLASTEPGRPLEG